eukprot:c18924_g1_i1 orf=449-1519(-)
MPIIMATQHRVLHMTAHLLPPCCSHSCTASAPGHIHYRLREFPNCKSACFAINPGGTVFAQQLHWIQTQRWRSWSKPGNAVFFQTRAVDLRSRSKRTREEFDGRNAGLVGHSSAVHIGAKGFGSKLAMRKSEVNSCSWFRPSEEEGSGVPLLGSLIQRPSGNADGNRVDERCDVEDGKLSRHNLRDFSVTFEETSDGAANRKSAATDSSFRSSNSSKSGPLLTVFKRFPSSHDANTHIRKAEAVIERAIFNSRFLSLLAVAGSLAGSLLCFLKGCFLIYGSYVAYYTMCLNGVDMGKVVIQVLEAVDIYLTGTAMLIFGMGLYGLFISNIPDNLHPSKDRALQVSSLFGMFILKLP